MFREDKVKRGDILLYKPTGSFDIGGQIIAIGSGGKYSHAGFCYGQFYGKWHTIESHLKKQVIVDDFGEVILDKNGKPWKANVCRKIIDPKDYQQIDIYRPLPSIKVFTEEKINILCKAFLDSVGGNYDLLALPGVFMHYIFGNALHLNFLREWDPLLENKKANYCSELIARKFNQAVYFDCVPNVSDSNSTPSDLGNSHVLYKVC